MIAIPAANQTPILTTWRTLTVEVYMMNLPGVHMPSDGGLLKSLMALACVAVQYVDNNPPLPLHDKSGRLWSDVNPQTYVNEFYPTFNSDYHWVVDVIGASVMPPSWNLDGRVYDGYNFDGPPWGNVKNGGPAFIFEKAPEMQRNPALEARVFAHEVLHCFFGPHGGLPEADEGIMNVRTLLPSLTLRQKSGFR